MTNGHDLESRSPLSTLARAILRALPVLANARIVAVIFAPLLVAAAIWTLIGWFAWGKLTLWLDTALQGEVSGGNPFGWTHFFAGAGAALLLMLAAVLTALLAVAILAMPVIVDTVAKRDFSALERKRGGTFAGSLGNALFTLATFLPLWFVALLLLWLPPLYLMVSLLLSAWLNCRLFRYDALATHASADEMKTVIRGARGRMFMLGLCLAPLSLIPVVNLFAPIYAGIAFTYLCLDELNAFRARNEHNFLSEQAGPWITPADGLTK